MTNKEFKTIEIKVYGRVQGVNFRNSTANMAKSSRLNGFVENKEDGSVHVVAQGPEGNLLELLKWTQHGSLLSKVEGMDYKWVADADEYKDFKVIKKESYVKDKIKGFMNLGKEIKKEIVPHPENLISPQHVVIIPDGNRRWAKSKGMRSWEAYWYVHERIGKMIEYPKEFNVKYLTFWGFSTENWKRDDAEELGQIMKIFQKTIERFRESFHKDEVRFRHLGRKDRLPEPLLKLLNELEEETKNYDKFHVSAALDYGGRDELVRAINSIIEKGEKEVDEDIVSKFLDTKGLPDPDLIIRTSGEKRLSGLMPWQSVYSEFYFTNVFFPDFGIDNFKDAVYEFSMRKRRFGGN